MPSTLPPGLLAPVLLLLAAAWMMITPGRRPPRVAWLPEAATLGVLALGVLALGHLLVLGPVTLAAGLVLRADALSVTMLLLVGFIGWVVMRNARSAMDGEPREGRFHALMLATLAAVVLVTQAGSLGTMVAGLVAVGLGVHQLLLFYPDRPEAQRAAAKFRLVWHGGDLALIGAAVLLWVSLGGTGFGGAAPTQGLPPLAHVAMALLVLGAMLKTAAFPLNGWLTEVMEAPTPVSALLHAGIINAGGLVLIRMADLLQASPGAMAALVLAGGFTALFGAVVMLTQSAAKTALAWSTVAQMGFMLLQCGLGLWALALLHIVAHSLYKAHAFLSAGGAVQAVAAVRRPGPVAVPRMGAVMVSFALALVLYAAMAGVFSLLAGPKSAQALALGAMLILGVAYLVAQGLADAAPAALTRRTAQASALAAAAYFGFQLGAGALWGPSLPPAPVAGPLEWALLVLAVLSFALVALAQTLFPLWAHHPAAAGLRVHLANGLYLNALLDRLIGGFRVAKSD